MPEAGPLETDAYDYQLPPSAIAQVPRCDRDGARMLVLGAAGNDDRRVRDLPACLRPGDLVVCNATRVRAARLRGWVGGRPAELLVLDEPRPGIVVALVRPGRRLHAGEWVSGAGWRAEVIGPAAGHPGARCLAVTCEAGVDLDRVGEVPLPPYIRVPLVDPARYQTVFAEGPAASAAAPTAGLHLTTRLLERLETAGIGIARVSLTIGLATFAPIRHPRIDQHPMHAEAYDCPPATAEAIRRCRQRGGRVVAVGTTVVRVLETGADGAGGVRVGSGVSRLYLRPGARLTVVDGLLTNFHQPRSSLLVLVSAVFGRERVLAAYRAALRRGYGFLSFGDCMLGWRTP
ncbi:MAG TPA: S-adenosylmethionine:tRNA ribosyltransferase-isomerase [Candidatus Micrarchaeia archaeon]|nr:S-adenosylmethionine:tRNA ribosyltransferase-isomerase [Candidatus Micrarchaeia archaeon]